MHNLYVCTYEAAVQYRTLIHLFKFSVRDESISVQIILLQEISHKYHTYSGEHVVGRCVGVVCGCGLAYLEGLRGGGVLQFDEDGEESHDVLRTREDRASERALTF